MTFAASMTTLSGLARLLAGDSVDTAVDRTRTAAEGAARSAERLLDDPEAFATDLEAWHGGRDVIVLLGRGPARAATELGALVLKESGVMAESLESGLFRHGPFELAGPNMSAIVMATEPETRRLDLGLAADLVDAGCAVMVVTPDGEAPKGARPVATGYLDRALMSAVGRDPHAAPRLAARGRARTHARRVHRGVEGHDPRIAHAPALRRRRLVDRQPCAHRGPVPELALDPATTSGELCALDHRRKADVSGLGRIDHADVEAAPVVGDHQPHAAVEGGDRDVDPRRGRVLARVRDRLLRDPEQHRSHLGGWLERQHVLDLGYRIRRSRVGAERGDEPLPVERRRPELEQQVTQPLDRCADHVAQLLGLLPELGILDPARESPARGCRRRS